GAGVFSARVFPLEAKKMHRVVIGYDVNLLRVGDDWVHRLDLPGGVSERMIDYSVAVPEGVTASNKPDAEETKVAGRVYYHFEHPEERTLTLRLSGLDSPLLTGSDPETGEYFAARVQPPLPEGDAVAGSSRAVFMVDLSLSSNPDRLNVWLTLLENILDKNRDSLKEFAVLFFNVESFWWKEEFSDNTPENVEALKDRIRELALEGATDLGQALTRAAQPNWLREEADPNQADVPRDLFLLSDGSATWGEGDLHAMSKSLRDANSGALFAYATGISGTDIRALGHLARETGGAVFSVTNEAAASRAAVAHRRRPWKLLGVETQGGSDLLLAGRPQTLFPGQRVLLVGRGLPNAEESKVVFHVRRGEEEKNIAVDLSPPISSDLAPRIYGQVAVGQLEDLLSAGGDVPEAYACHFRVTGRSCSLLMLETEEDYLRFNIKPEEHAFVVKRTPVAPRVEKILAEFGAAFGDPKAGFMKWLKDMEDMPGVEFKVSAALRTALESLPRESFEVAARPLSCKVRDWESVPGDLQEQLASRKLTYDSLTRESYNRLKQAGPDDALKALSSLVENSPGDMVLTREVGFSAMVWGLGGQAYHLFRRAAQKRPYEPHTYWSMAQCLREMDKTDLALAYYEAALSGQWDARFGAFSRILALDYLHLLREIADGKRESLLSDFAAARRKTLSKQYPLKTADVMISVTWNTDGSDVDLHVVEPSGEDCHYGYATTKQGGRITSDVTQGYGPEMYSLPKAKPG
ncbi:MAG: hypothetical protein N2C14_07065, partial [Planctomycetales bacterium]